MTPEIQKKRDELAGERVALYSFDRMMEKLKHELMNEFFVKGFDACFESMQEENERNKNLVDFLHEQESNILTLKQENKALTEKLAVAEKYKGLASWAYYRAMCYGDNTSQEIFKSEAFTEFKNQLSSLEELMCLNIFGGLTPAGETDLEEALAQIEKERARE